MDPTVALCIEEEKKKCLEVIQAYYKKNNHPSILRLRDYLMGQNHTNDPIILEDLDRIKTYLSTTDEVRHYASFSIDA